MSKPFGRVEIRNYQGRVTAEFLVPHPTDEKQDAWAILYEGTSVDAAVKVANVALRVLAVAGYDTGQWAQKRNKLVAEVRTQ